jgi:Tol biopolymer transport system component
MKQRLHLAAAAVLLLAAPASLAQQPAPQPPARHASMPVATRDGQRIAFWSERDGHAQIYTMKADGSDVRRLTNSPRTDLGADWSPDGQWLVFASYAEGSDLGEITRIRADGTDRRTLARGKDARWPRVSSDGKKIAFTQEDEKGADGVYVMDADGSNLKPFPTGLAQAWEPAWSPDGRHLLFSQPPANPRDLATAKTTIYVAEVSGANRRLVATVPGVLQIPRWSPDGRKVAYQVYKGPDWKDAHILLIDVASGEVKTLTRHDRPYLDETPSWLPDGSLLFQSTRDGSFEIYRMNGDGSEQRRISPR